MWKRSRGEVNRVGVRSHFHPLVEDAAVVGDDDHPFVLLGGGGHGAKLGEEGLV